MTKKSILLAEQDPDDEALMKLYRLVLNEFPGTHGR